MKTEPYYPQNKVSYGNVFFFLRVKVYSINPFDKEAINDAKYLMLREAKDCAPSYRDFIKAATAATQLSEASILTILRDGNKKQTNKRD